MNDVGSLNEWESVREKGFDIEADRPKWFKFWVEKYATALDIANLDDDLDEEDKEELFTEIGKALVNALFYFLLHDKGEWLEYKLNTRDGRIIWNALKRDIEQSYRDYDQRVINGAKGGRPKKYELPEDQ